jgi:tetratricopeptide (TPR) repeat protein
MDALARALQRARRSSAPGLAGLAAIGGVAAVALVALAVWPEPACEPARALIGETWGRTERAAVDEGLRRSGVAAPQQRAAWVDARLGTFFDAWTAARDETCRGVEENPDLDRDAAFACLRRQRAAARSAIDMLSAGEEVEGGLFAIARLDDPAECGREGTIAPAPELEDRVAELRAELERAVSISHVRRSEPVRRAADEIVQKAEKLGYAPLLAEALLLQATVVDERSAELEGEAMLERAFSLATEAGDARLELRAAAALAESLGTTGRRFDDGERWLRTARSLAGRAPLEAWRIDIAQARMRRIQHRLAEAIELHRSGLEQAEAVLGKGHIYVARARIGLAMDLATNQQLEEAGDELDIVMGELVPAFGPDHPVLADAYYVRAQLRRGAGDLDGAVEAMRASVDAVGADKGELTLARADRLQALGALTAQSGRYVEAREYMERVLDFYDTALPPDDPRIGILLGNVALVYRYLGDHAQARSYAERAVVVAQSRQGETAPLATALSLLSDVLFAGDEFEAAVAQCRRGLALEGVSADRRISLRQTLAVSLGALGQREEAVAELAAAAETALQLYGPTPDTGALLANEAYHLAELGRLPEAQQLIHDAVKMIEDGLGADDYGVSRPLHIQVFIESKAGNHAEAVRLARRVLELRKDAGNDPLELAAAHFSLAKALRKARKNPDEVLEEANIALQLYVNSDSREDVAEIKAFLGGHSTSRTARASSSRR